MRLLRLLVTVTLAAGLVPLAAAAASAAPPGNDEPGGAVALHLGDRVVQDTSQATTNAQDEALNAECGAPATLASVWYRYTPDVDREVVLDMTSSDYGGGMLVFEGPPTADSLVACGAGLVALSAVEGTTYTIMVISDTDVTGGRLVLTLKPPPPPPQVRVTVAKRGLAHRSGAARIHGTYSCKNAEYAGLFGTLIQRAGRLKIPADFYTEIRCDGRGHRWTARAVSPTGIYARGRARATATASACGFLECTEAMTRRRIHLMRARGQQGQRSVQSSTSGRERPRPLVERQWHWPRS